MRTAYASGKRRVIFALNALLYNYYKKYFLYF